MRKTFTKSTLVAGLLLALAFASCQSNDQALENDGPATAEINRVLTVMNTGQKISQEDIDSLQKINEKYPGVKKSQEALHAALISRQDWAALEKFYAAKKSAGEFTVEDQANLGKVYINLGHFADAVETLVPLKDGGNVEMVTLLANAYFQLGRYDEAKELLDGNWEKILAEKRIAAMVTRGMIYFYQADKDRAITVLEKAHEIEPENIAAGNGLSRVYSAMGNQEKADEYIEKVQNTFNRMTAEEQAKTRFVSQIYKLQEAYQAGRHQEVVIIAERLIPQADPRNKQALYQYLYKSYQALGKPKEAQESLTKAQQMQTQ